MAATSLGLVGIVSKGEYSASATYIKGNFVYHNQSTWLCIAETITGSEPSESNSNWQLLAKGVQLVVFTGATASTDGTMGAVPQPHAGDEGKFLKGSGGWANVPDPQVFTGATTSADGTSGLVPVPHMGDENKFIRGDGSWASAAADDNFVGTLAQWNALSAADKTKYKTADITNDFNGSPVDSALSDTSSNPVQNRVITEAFGGIGTKLFGNAEGGTNIIVPNDTVTVTYSVELTKGKWLVIGSIDWAANTNGYRQIQFGDSGSINPNRDSAVTSVPSSLATKEHYMQIVRLFELQSTSIISLYALQTSGGDLTAYPQLVAIRIR